MPFGYEIAIRYARQARVVGGFNGKSDRLLESKKANRERLALNFGGGEATGVQLSILVW